MFDSLKSKLKTIFRKGDKIEEEAKKAVPPEKLPPEEPEIREVEQPPQTPVPEPEKKPAKKLSKKERREQAKSRFRAEDMLSDSVLGKKIGEEPLDDLLDELEATLLESDVAYPVVQDIIVGVRKNLAGKKYDREYTLGQVVELAVKDAVGDVLSDNAFDFDEWIKEQSRPTVIMFVGINGTGKTTTIAKFAYRLKSEGYSITLAACDTFRAGAIEQLSVHAKKLGVEIIKSIQNADPASVAFDAVEHARSKRKDIVLIDTAGRMQTNHNLMAEMQKIARIAKPDLNIFVGDALAGNDAIQQAKMFDEALNLDAVILTKIDTDAKGGAALSIAKSIGKPIAFVCSGQEYGDMEKFDANWMMERLFED